MLEFYQAYADYHDLMDLTEDLLRRMAVELLGDSLDRLPGQSVRLRQALPAHDRA